MLILKPFDGRFSQPSNRCLPKMKSYTSSSEELRSRAKRSLTETERNSFCGATPSVSPVCPAPANLSTFRIVTTTKPRRWALQSGRWLNPRLASPRPALPCPGRNRTFTTLDLHNYLLLRLQLQLRIVDALTASCFNLLRTDYGWRLRTYTFASSIP